MTPPKYSLGVAGCLPLDPLSPSPADHLPQVIVFAVPSEAGDTDAAAEAAEAMTALFEHPRVRAGMIVSTSEPDDFPVGAAIGGRDALVVRYRGHRERHSVPGGLVTAMLEQRRFMITLIGRPWPFPAARRRERALLCAFLNDPATRPRAGLVVPLVREHGRGRRVTGVR
ncbi:hypothetical protein [Actinomadura harenae]|uniref:Uncharacterized protein n=1 Tax=Actinomadura harenae TaxID=2483351 RepID=A0A3M2LMV9_9ACTN|nr:hypothetical protein [Actinomadura harenae]RMI37863.1 hypothetical protein EBO15_34585 [Actinomadura harenae]